MSSIKNPQRRRLLKTLAATSALGVSGLALAQTGAAKAPRVLRIGYQKGWLSILKARGTLDKRLAALGASVTWTEFTAGPVQLEALNVGSIDFGDVGEAPPIFAQAAGAPLVYVGSSNPRPKLEAIVVPQDSPIRSVADLKGKKIAFNKGSNVQYLIVKLLEKHGLKYGDVIPVFLPPADARAAFEKGSIDAWIIWDPFLASAEVTLEARVLADAQGVVNNRGYYFSSLDYANRNDDVIKIVIEELNKIDQWAAANRGAIAQELSGLWGIPKPVVDKSVARTVYGTTPITRAILQEQQVIADTFFELKLIPKKINLLEAAAGRLG